MQHSIRVLANIRFLTVILVLTFCLLYSGSSVLLAQPDPNPDSLALAWEITTDHQLVENKTTFPLIDSDLGIWLLGQGPLSQEDSHGVFLQKYNWQGERQGWTAWGNMENPSMPLNLVRGVNDTLFAGSQIMRADDSTDVSLGQFYEKKTMDGQSGFGRSTPDTGADDIIAKSMMIATDSTIVVTGIAVHQGVESLFIKKLDTGFDELWHREMYIDDDVEPTILPLPDGGVRLIATPRNFVEHQGGMDRRDYSREGDLEFTSGVIQFGSYGMMGRLKISNDRYLFVMKYLSPLGEFELKLHIEDVNQRMFTSLVDIPLEDAIQLVDLHLVSQPGGEEERYILRCKYMVQDTPGSHPEVSWFCIDSTGAILWEQQETVVPITRQGLVAFSDGSLMTSTIRQDVNDEEYQIDLVHFSDTGEQLSMYSVPVGPMIGLNENDGVQSCEWVEGRGLLLEGRITPEGEAYVAAWLTLLAPELIDDVPSPVVEVPSDWGITSTWPNPFNASTTIGFKLDQQRNIRLSVFDLLGREVAVLREGITPAGQHVVSWQADHLPSGIYMLDLLSTNHHDVKRVTLIK